jgi:hypothetical protein
MQLKFEQPKLPVLFKAAEITEKREVTSTKQVTNFIQQLDSIMNCEMSVPNRNLNIQKYVGKNKKFCGK